jgi:hypothetical protein
VHGLVPLKRYDAGYEASVAALRNTMVYLSAKCWPKGHRHKAFRFTADRANLRFANLFIVILTRRTLGYGGSISNRSCENESAALNGADQLGGSLHGGLTRGAGLVLGQRAIFGAEPQRQGQRLAALSDLRAGIDVE